MAFYSNDIISQLKNHADIADVIQQFVPLKASGTNRYTGRCPFHDDKSPSMSVNSAIGIYKCFACNAGGDVFKFVMEHEKVDFKAAVEWVARATNVAMQEDFDKTFALGNMDPVIPLYIDESVAEHYLTD